MDHILHKIFKISLRLSHKKHETVTDNFSIRICVDKMGNRVIFKTEKGYYLELLTPETLKLLGSIINKITDDKNCELFINYFLSPKNCAF